MAFCEKCGAEIKAEERFCGACGAPVGKAEPTEETKKAEGEPANGEKTAFEENFAKLNDTKDTTSEYTKEDIEAGKGMAILSYFYILVLVPLFASKSKFVRFHTNQGLILLICEVIVSILYWILPWRLDFIASILGFAVGILAILGIINAVNGKAKELPFVGKFKIIK